MMACKILQGNIISIIIGLNGMVWVLERNFSENAIRPGKLDLLFRISHLLDLHVGGIHYSLFIECMCKSEGGLRTRLLSAMI